MFDENLNAIFKRYACVKEAGVLMTGEVVQSIADIEGHDLSIIVKQKPLMRASGSASKLGDTMAVDVAADVSDFFGNYLDINFSSVKSYLEHKYRELPLDVLKYMADVEVHLVEKSDLSIFRGNEGRIAGYLPAPPK